MTILNEAINRLVRESINLALDQPNFAIRAKQNAPRPAAAYATVDHLSTTSAGLEYKSVENLDADNVTLKVEGSRLITMSLQFYRDNAIDNAAKVRTALSMHKILKLFNAAGVGLIERTPLTHISLALKDEWEERAAFDVTVNAVASDSETVETINAVVMTMTNGDYTESIEISEQ